MIVNRDINPNKSLYYLGAKVIATLKELDSETVDIIEVSNKLNKAEKVSMPLLILTFDWLFLLGVVDISENGIKLCL